MKVLLIGSDKEIVFMTAKILRRSQYEVYAAIGKNQAAEMLCDEDFVLVILDCDMSNSDYTEIIHKVKQKPDPPPLIVISGDKENEITILEAGANDWIQKPYKMDVLLARMAALLRNKK